MENKFTGKGPYIHSDHPIYTTSVPGTADYHGGYAYEHLREMKEISEHVANEVVASRLESLLPAI